MLARLPFALVTAAAAFAATAYLYVHETVGGLFSYSRTLTASACEVPAAQETKQNADSALFISCGGFLE